MQALMQAPLHEREMHSGQAINCQLRERARTDLVSVYLLLAFAVVSIIDRQI